MSRSICIILAAVCLLLYCSGCGAATKEYSGIEYTGEVTADNFALLFNTLGYEQKGTKRAFVRSVEYVDPGKVGSNSVWTLLNAKNEVVSQGRFIYRGLAYGIQLWEMDFSEVTKPGQYRLIAEFTDKKYNPVYQEASTVFQIQNRVYSNNVLLPLTLYNAQARVAPQDVGGGYYDCNTTMGEAYSHGVFLNGLVQTYVYQRATLSDEEIQGLWDAAARAFDYLLKLHDDATGEFIHSYPTRYNADINQGMHNTYEALYGFCAYLHYFSGLDPERASQENFEKAVKSVDYLDTYISDDYAAQLGYPHKEYLTPVYYYLYMYSGDTQWRDKGIELINKQLDTMDVRSMRRNGARSIPMMEGVYLFAQEIKGTEQYDQWIDKLVQIKDTYYAGMGEKNAFAILPISEGFMAAKEWDNMWKMPVGEYETNWLITTGRAVFAMDACFLGKLTGDKSLEEIAAGEIGYVFGLNPGFEGELVLGANSNRKIAAGALVDNLNAQRVRGWFNWEFTLKNDQWVSIMNGYRVTGGEYVFKDETFDDWYYGETFIKHDGAFAYAMCVYEEYVNQN